MKESTEQEITQPDALKKYEPCRRWFFDRRNENKIRWRYDYRGRVVMNVADIEELLET